LFVAIAPTPDVCRALEEAQRRLSRCIGDTDRAPRWVRPEQAHMTLAFIGHVDAPALEALVAAASRPYDQPSFEIGFGGVGIFPAHGAPRVLSLGVRDGRAELEALRNLVVARLTALAIPFDTKPFRPHLTLARWRHSRPSDRRAIEIEPAAVARMRVDIVSLYNSHAAAGTGPRAGPAYTSLAGAPLAC
jgi:2'-5' RNA ligase